MKGFQAGARANGRPSAKAGGTRRATQRMAAPIAWCMSR